jgi:site-specific DNA recombinase
MKRKPILNNKTEEKKKYIIYTRCSTDEQAMGDYTTLDAQAHHCKNMLDAFGYELADFGKKGIVNDDGYSGKDLSRPGIQQILQSIETQRPFDGIIFFRLDRLTRNPRDLYAMIDLFKEKDIDFISVRENLDSSTAIGRVVIGILGLLSAFERELTGERVKASAIARVRQGYRVGGTTPIGYKLVKDGPQLPNGKQPKKIVLDEKVAPHLKIVWEMAAENRSLVEIAETLMKRGVYTRNKLTWRKQGVSLILKNPFYKGYIRYNGELHPGKHEPLVEEKMWDKANDVMNARKPGKRLRALKHDHKFLLSGLIKCGKCGSHLVSVHSSGRDKKKFFYYECGRSRQGLGCDYNRIPANGLDQAVIKYFKQASENAEVIYRAIGNAIQEAQMTFDKIDAQMKEKDKRLSLLKRETQKLLDLALKNSVAKGTTYKAKMTELEREIIELEDEMDKLRAKRNVAQMNAQSGEFTHSNIRLIMQHMADAPAEIQKNLLQMLIHSIIVYDDTIEMNLFVQPECLPQNLPEMPLKDENPDLNDDQDGVNAETVALKDSVSTYRQEWGG